MYFLFSNLSISPFSSFLIPFPKFTSCARSSPRELRDDGLGWLKAVRRSASRISRRWNECISRCHRSNGSCCTRKIIYQKWYLHASIYLKFVFTFKFIITFALLSYVFHKNCIVQKLSALVSAALLVCFLWDWPFARILQRRFRMSPNNCHSAWDTSETHLRHQKRHLKHLDVSWCINRIWGKVRTRFESEQTPDIDDVNVTVTLHLSWPRWTCRAWSWSATSRVCTPVRGIHSIWFRFSFISASVCG